jgi:hypothetical protein
MHSRRHSVADTGTQRGARWGRHHRRHVHGGDTGRRLEPLDVGAARQCRTPTCTANGASSDSEKDLALWLASGATTITSVPGRQQGRRNPREWQGCPLPRKRWQLRPATPSCSRATVARVTLHPHTIYAARSNLRKIQAALRRPASPWRCSRRRW